MFNNPTSLQVNATDNKGETALMKAAENNRLEIVKALLGPRSLVVNGKPIPPEAEVNAEDKQGQTALAKAKAKQYEEIMDAAQEGRGPGMSAHPTALTRFAPSAPITGGLTLPARPFFWAPFNHLPVLCR